MSFKPTDNYFELFGISPAFDISAQQLAGHRKKLQTVLHPDRYVAASPQERRIAAQNAALVNEAYRVLTDDCERAAYLLKLKGMDCDSESHTMDDADFLMEQMSLREALEEQADSTEGLSEMKTAADARLRELGGQFQQAYTQNAMEDAQSQLAKMQFFKRLKQQIESHIRRAEEAVPTRT